MREIGSDFITSKITRGYLKEKKHPQESLRLWIHLNVKKGKP